MIVRKLNLMLSSKTTQVFEGERMDFHTVVLLGELSYGLQA